MVEASEEQGIIQAEETDMIHSILDFGDTVARRVMTPRIDMTAISVTANLPELLRLVNESGHSRIPVFEEDLDNIVGIIHVKDLLPLLVGEESPVDIRGIMRQPYVIPETKKVADLLTEFRRTRQQMAIVSDEYGVTAGLITIEDLLEEIVGDIQDEYDEEEPELQVINETTTLLDGRMALQDVNERLALELPEDESDTIAGFVFSLLGHQAVVGDKVQWNEITFTVESTDGRRIQKLRVVRDEVTGGKNSTSPNLLISKDAQ